MINNQNLAVLSEKVARLESAVANSTSASGISYDNTDSGLTADDLQEAIDEVAPALTAEGTSYDNTDSGLTADDVQGAIDEVMVKIKKYDTLLNTALTTESASYDLAHDKRDYNLICIAVAWAGGANSNFITLPPSEIYNGSTKIYLNGDITGDYATISVFGNTSVTALASNANVHLRVYGIM